MVLDLAVGSLTKLTHLICEINLNEKVPKGIGALGQLRHLEFISAKFTVLPPDLGELTELTSLQINYGELTSLPPEIGQLTNLVHLGLGYNKLEYLPDTFVHLSNLEELDIGGNNWKDLSATALILVGLPNLKVLRLGCGNTTEIAREIGELTHLRSLTLTLDQYDPKEKRLCFLPYELLHLKKLTSLSLQELGLSDLSEFDFSVLEDLEELDMSSNP